MDPLADPSILESRVSLVVLRYGADHDKRPVLGDVLVLMRFVGEYQCEVTLREGALLSALGNHHTPPIDDVVHMFEGMRMERRISSGLDGEYTEREQGRSVVSRYGDLLVGVLSSLHGHLCLLDPIQVRYLHVVPPIRTA